MTDSRDTTYRVTFHDGTTEDVTGRLLLIDGAVLTIQSYCSGSDALWEQHSYPLTSLRKWEALR